jgi:hypothetical protein
MNYRSIQSWPAEQEDEAKQQMHDKLPPTSSILRDINSPSTVRFYSVNAFECDQINQRLVDDGQEPAWEPDPDKRL